MCLGLVANDLLRIREQWAELWRHVEYLGFVSVQLVVSDDMMAAAGGQELTVVFKKRLLLRDILVIRFIVVAFILLWCYERGSYWHTLRLQVRRRSPMSLVGGAVQKRRTNPVGRMQPRGGDPP